MICNSLLATVVADGVVPVRTVRVGVGAITDEADGANEGVMDGAIEEVVFWAAVIWILRCITCRNGDER